MQIVRRSILIVVCIAVLLSSFIFPSFAVEAVPDPDMLDEGWFFDEGDYYMPAGFQFPLLLTLNEPNYPDFDTDKIPWEDAPNYIKEILYNTPFIPTSNTEYINPWKIPFVAVIVGANNFVVYVGINLRFASYYASLSDKTNGIPTGTYVVCEVLSSSGSVNVGVEYACCYSATFKSNTYEVVSSWAPCSKTSVGDRYTRFSGNCFDYNIDRDIYCYGGNAIRPGVSAYSSNIYTVNNDSYNSNGFPAFYSVTDSSVGFDAGPSAIVFNNALYSNYYLKSFVPTTYEDKQLEVNKGIWGSIKDLPSNIANSIKSFFTNLGDRISSFFENLKNYLLYFQETKPEHVNPFDDILTDVKRYFSAKIDDTTEFKSNLHSTLNKVSSYISSGSGIINTFLTAVPVLSAFVSFFIVFFVVRKVIGR